MNAPLFLPTRFSGAPIAVFVMCLLMMYPPAAQASFLPPEVMDTAATYLAWFIVIVLPIAGVVVFLLIHILPEKVAEKRHHPQKDAIQTLCLLSLFFGGLLWPLAWLWAYTRPVTYRAAYGTEKSDDYFVKMADRAAAGELDAHAVRHLREEFEAMAAAGGLNPTLQAARARFAASQALPDAPAPAPAALVATSAQTGAA
jgi:CBS domain containing-hemolysin-like protein